MASSKYLDRNNNKDQSPKENYIQVSSHRGVILEFRIKKINPFFLLSLTILLLFLYLIFNVLSDTSSNYGESNQEASSVKSINLPLLFKNSLEQLQAIQKKQEKIFITRFSFEQMQQTRYPGLEEQLVNTIGVGGKLPIRKTTPLSKLIWIQNWNQRLVKDMTGFINVYHFWIQSWPHLWPLKSNSRTVTSNYGYRKRPNGSNSGQTHFHKGIDLRGKTGTPVQAVASGVVHIAKSKRYGYGKRVRIVHDTGYETLYAHMQYINIKENQRILAGDIIGAVGNTGNSTGPHLHYEVRFKGKALNPKIFMK